jgi:cytidine deaminase
MIPQDTPDGQALLERAIIARQNAHAPYSRFLVGAAIACSDGSIFCGCNVENLSFGLTMCAERVAVGAAVAAGHTDFVLLAVVADTDEVISPCGACRQVLAEFSPSLPILSANLRGRQGRFSLADLLPRASTGILNRP